MGISDTILSWGEPVLRFIEQHEMYLYIGIGIIIIGVTYVLVIR